MRLPVRAVLVSRRERARESGRERERERGREREREREKERAKGSRSIRVGRQIRPVGGKQPRPLRACTRERGGWEGEGEGRERERERAPGLSRAPSASPGLRRVREREPEREPASPGLQRESERAASPGLRRAAAGLVGAGRMFRGPAHRPAWDASCRSAASTPRAPMCRFATAGQIIYTAPLPLGAAWGRTSNAVDSTRSSKVAESGQRACERGGLRGGLRLGWRIKNRRPAASVRILPAPAHLCILWREMALRLPVRAVLVSRKEIEREREIGRASCRERVCQYV